MEGQFVPGAPMFIPRADVADFMLSSLDTHDWDRKCVAIGKKAWHGIWLMGRVAKWLFNTFIRKTPCESHRKVKRRIKKQKAKLYLWKSTLFEHFLVKLSDIRSKMKVCMHWKNWIPAKIGSFKWVPTRWRFGYIADITREQKSCCRMWCHNVDAREIHKPRILFVSAFVFSLGYMSVCMYHRLLYGKT